MALLKMNVPRSDGDEDHVDPAVSSKVTSFSTLRVGLYI